LNVGAGKTLSVAGTLTVTGAASTIDATAIGATTPDTGAFTTLSASSTLTATGAGSIQGLTVGRGAGAVATNTAVGASALAANTSGDTNTASGFQALTTNTSGLSNTATGVQALRFNTSGGANAAFGRGSLANNTTGGNNVACGQEALNSNTTASNGTAVGYRALYVNTTGNAVNSFGANSLEANTTGSYNAAFGNATLQSNSTGSYNTAIGVLALLSNTTADNNTAVGYQAGYTNTTGVSNTFIGIQAGYTSNATASNGFNVAIGRQAGYNLTTASSNTFVGSNAGQLVTSGAKNTILGGYDGNQGGLDIRTSSNYIVLSDGDGNPRGVFDASGNYLLGTATSTPASITAHKLVVERTASVFAAAFGYATDSTARTQVSFYNSNGSVGTISTSGTATAYNTSSDYRLKNTVTPMTGALAKVAALKPVAYKWNADGSDGEGFIAHELAEVCPQAVHGTKDAVDENGKPIYQGIDVSFLVATLTAAIQELKAEFDAYKATHP